MAVKYRIQYRAYDNILWQIDLSLIAYSGDIIPVKGVMDSACIIEWDGGVDDPFDNPLLNSKATFRIYNQGQIDVLELQNAQDTDFKAAVYRNSVLKWVGYIIPDGIQQPFAGTPYDLTITATDGLKLMSGRPYQHNNLDAPAGGVPRCPLNFLRQALFDTDNLGIMLPIRWYIGLECDAYPGEDVMSGNVQWSPRGEGFSESMGGTKDNLYIIEGIVKSFGCRIFQWDGAWHIMRSTDIVYGTFTYNECNATLGTPTITTHTVDINKSIGTDYPFISEDAILTVKPGLKRVDVRYEHSQLENILPNGNMDVWSVGFLVNWSYISNPSDDAEISQFQSLNARTGYATQLTFPQTTGGREAEFGLYVGGAAKLPIDANILFKRMTLGFTLLPQFGFPYDTETGLINWDDYPLQIKVSYTITEGGVSTVYYLNEFGFWVSPPDSTDLNTISYTYTLLPNPSPNAEFKYVFGGTPHAFVSLRFTMTYFGVPGISKDITIAFEYGETLLDLMTRLATELGSDTDFVNFSVTDIGGGQVQFQFEAPEFYARDAEVWSIQSAGLVPGNRIGVTIPNLKINDVAAVEFNRRQEIIIPDPGILDGTQPSGVGELQIIFYVFEGQQYVLDDVWMRVDENNDVYRASLSTSKNTDKQDISLQISSSFSGFMLSNYMSSFDASNEEFLFTDLQSYNGSLTHLYARSVMNFRYLSSIIFNGTFNVRNKDWSIFEMYSIATLTGLQFLPLNAKYNTEKCEVNIIAMEARNSDLTTLTVEHLGSNEMPLSNFGG